MLPVQPSPACPPVAVQVAPGEIVHVSLVGVPAITVVGLAEIVALIDPVPESGTAKGTALEVIVSAPTRPPIAVGAKLT